MYAYVCTYAIRTLRWCFAGVGTVMKLLQRVHRETELRVDVVEVPFPIESQESVSKLYYREMS